MDVEMLSKTPCNLSCISQDGLTLSEQEEKDPAVIVSLKEDKNDAQRSMAAEAADAIESSGSASKEVEKSSQISGAETPSDALETTAPSCTSMSVTAASQSTPIASQPSLVFSFPANNLTDSSAASCPPSSGLETSTSGMTGPGTLLLGTEGLAGVTTLQSLGGAVGGGGIVLLPVQTLSAPAATGQMLQVLPCKAAPVNNPTLVGSNIPLQIIGGTFPGQTTTLASPQVLPAFIVQSIEGQLQQQQQQQQQLGVISMVAPTSTVANTLTPASPITSASATHILAASQGQVLATLLGASGVGSLLHIGSGTPAPTLNQITSTSVGGQAQVPGSSVAASGPTGPTVTNLVIGNQLFGTLGLGGQTLGVTGTSGLGGQLCSMLPSGCRVLGPGGQVFQVLNPGSVGGTSLCAKPGQQTGLASNTKGISVIGQKLTFGLDSPPPTGQFHKVMQERDAIEKCNGSPKVLKTCKASSPPSSDVKNSMGTIDLQEIREFAKAFKLRRLSLSLTQTQVGHALSVSEGPAYSQSAICRFEKLDLTPKSAQKMMPILERWMCEAEARYQNNPNGLSDFIGSEPSRRRRRRTSFTPNALVALNCYFEGNMHPAGQEMTELAERLGYDREVVRIWFCNKRQALKNTIKQIKGHGASVQTSIAGLPTVTLSNVSMVADPTGTVTGGPSAIEPREMDSSVCAVSVSALVENSENTD